jgi:endonuclease YncB( thermonuclease family)
MSLHKRHLFMFLCSVAATMVTASSESFSAKVTAVNEGDVLTILRDGAAAPEELRLYGVDCPEPGQPMNDEARKFTSEKALNQTVSVEVIAKDNEGKAVAIVTLDGDVRLHQALLAAGLAWWDSENTPEDRELRRQSAAAITTTAGLWKDPAPLSPWDYRRSHNLPSIKYSLKNEDPKPAEKHEEKPKVLSAKGTEVYKGGFSAIAPDTKSGQAVTPQRALTTPARSVGPEHAGKLTGSPGSQSLKGTSGLGQAQASSGETVYITDTGGKYHTASCRHLNNSKIQISLEYARAQGYTPCSVCGTP